MGSAPTRLAQCEAILAEITGIVRDQRALEEHQRSARLYSLAEIDFGRADAYKKIDRVLAETYEGEFLKHPSKKRQSSRVLGF